MQNRREFLKRASLMLAGGMVMPQLLSSCAGKASASESSKYIGLQLYSLRDLVKEEGIQKVLETASKMGYKNLKQPATTMVRSMVWLRLSSRRW